MRTILTLAAVLALTASAAVAKPCHDAKGKFVKCPVAAARAATHATCKDGTSWTGKTHRGACSRHGGVKSWG